jgi:hypothetical protein
MGRIAHRLSPGILVTEPEPVVPLPRPTVDLVNKARADFDDENQLSEAALRKLREAFPRNVEPAQVLLKVLVLNELYNVRVLGIDVEPLALHIVSLRVDPMLISGSPAAVGLIKNCPGLNQYYSFATKFCCWHNPAAYPMYDGNMDECLWSYQKHDGFSVFERQDLYAYEKLVSIVSSFRTYYGLESFSFRELDKFLWRMGEWILRQKEGSEIS